MHCGWIEVGKLKQEAKGPQSSIKNRSTSMSRTFDISQDQLVPKTLGEASQGVDHRQTLNMSNAHRSTDFAGEG